MKLFISLLVVAAIALAEEKNVQKLFADANSRFTTDFFNVAVKKAPGKSAVMSAYSVMLPLSMLAVASTGQSQTEILRAVGFPNVETAKSVFPTADDQLTNIKGVTFKKANRIYIREQAELNPEFAETAKKLFHSEVRNVDFLKNVAVAKEINTWVEDQTNNRIKNLVNPDSFDVNTRAVLVNAIYFKGTWKHQFTPELTREENFRGTGKQVKVPMMYISETFKYALVPELDAQILELPYEGDEASFVVVLPQKDDGLKALEEKLKDPSVLPNALKQLRETKVDVFLPKFKIESTWNLKELLSDVGVKRLFVAGQADLKNMLKGNEDLYISEAVQKAFIEVNEEGAEAAAANGLVLDLYINESNPVFIADHPFIFNLFGQSDRQPLFNGVFHP